MKNEIGSYSFMIGVIIAVFLAAASENIGTTADWLWLLLVAAGILVGLLNISKEKSRDFLWFTAALAVISFAGSAQISSWARLGIIGQYLKGGFESILAFIIPAGVVAALKEILILLKGD